MGTIIAAREFDAAPPAAGQLRKITQTLVGNKVGMDVNILAGGGSGNGTQYTEGDIDATITGTVAMWEDAADTLRAPSVAKPFPTQISDGTRTATVRDTGATDSLNVAITDAAGNQIVSFGGGTQYTEGDTDASITGTAMLWEDASDTLRAVSAAKPLPIGDAGGSLTVDNATISVVGGGVEATAQRVTIANDSTGVLSVDDNGGSLTIDAASLPLPTGAATAALQTQPGVDIGDVTINNSTGAAAVNIQDGGNAITVDYATTGSGTATGALRVELPTNGTGVIATVSAVTAITNALPAGTNAIGKLAANSGVDIGDVDVTSVIPGTSATNLGKAEDAAHTSADTGVFILAVRNDSGATVFTNANGDYSPIGVTSNGALYLASVIPGTTATELGKAEDQAHASGDVGVMSLAKRQDTPVANANVSADADYLPLITDNLGKLWTAQTQTEDAAHASGDRGEFILGVRNTANSTLAGTDGDYAPVAVDIMSGPISGVRRSTTSLSAINTTYDDSPTSANSASVDCSMFRRGSFCATVTESGTATDITFTLQFSNDGGTTWFDYRVGPWVKYRFDDATIAAHTSGQLKICEPFECVAPTCRMAVVGVGTDASNSFTVANATFELVN